MAQDALYSILAFATAIPVIAGLLRTSRLLRAGFFPVFLCVLTGIMNDNNRPLKQTEFEYLCAHRFLFVIMATAKMTCRFAKAIFLLPAGGHNRLDRRQPRFSYVV